MRLSKQLTRRVTAATWLCTHSSERVSSVTVNTFNSDCSPPASLHTAEMSAPHQRVMPGKAVGPPSHPVAEARREFRFLTCRYGPEPRFTPGPLRPACPSCLLPGGASWDSVRLHAAACGEGRNPIGHKQPGGRDLRVLNGLPSGS